MYIGLKLRQDQKNLARSLHQWSDDELGIDIPTRSEFRVHVES